MRWLRAFLSSVLACAATAAVCRAADSTANDAKPVKLIVGNLVPADKTIEEFQGIGAPAIRAGLIKWVGQNRDIKLFTLLERDQTFQVSEKIEDEERRGASLKSTTVSRLFSDKVNYFIFLTYKLVENEQVRLIGQLAKISAEQSLVVNTVDMVVNRQNPELSTFGQNLFVDILKAENAKIPRSFSLVFCEGPNQSDGAVEWVRSSVMTSFSGDRPSQVIEIIERTCANGRGEPVSESEIVVIFKIIPNVGVEVELTHLNRYVAHGQLRIMKGFIDNPEDSQKKIDQMIDQIRKSWNPPS